MVLVCHDHKFIFLKTRKTAGTSIEMLLEPLCAPPGHIVTEKTEGLQSSHGIIGYRLLGEANHAKGQTSVAIENKPSIWRSHMPAHQVRDALPQEQWRSYHRFSCLRNPFDKVVSHFFWGRDARGEPPLPDLDTARPVFREFVLARRLNNDRSIVHRKKRFILNGFLRFEALADDLKELCAKLKLPISVDDMPRAKSATSRLKDIPISAYYDPETANVVRDELDWVFEYGGYSANPEDADARIAPLPPKRPKNIR